MIARLNQTHGGIEFEGGFFLIERHDADPSPFSTPGIGEHADDTLNAAVAEIRTDEDQIGGVRTTISGIG